MTVMIQIRNVPDDVHRKLKSRAALAGMSLSDYVVDELLGMARRPALEELKARLGSYPETSLSETPAKAVRAERDRQ